MIRSCVYLCVCVHDNTLYFSVNLLTDGLQQTTTDLIHINKPNLYDENLMPTISDWVLSVYAQLAV